MSKLFSISFNFMNNFAGICYNLSVNKNFYLNEDLFAKIFCIIEVIITDEESQEMVSISSNGAY